MKKLIVAALAIYGGAKIGEKILKKYRKPITEWVGRKAKEAADRIIYDILEKDEKESPKSEKSVKMHSNPYSSFHVRSRGTFIGKPDVTADERHFEISHLNTEEMLYTVKKFKNGINEYGQLTVLDVINDIDPELYSCIPTSLLGYGWDDAMDTELSVYPVATDHWRIVFPQMVKMETYI